MRWDHCVQEGWSCSRHQDMNDYLAANKSPLRKLFSQDNSGFITIQQSTPRRESDWRSDCHEWWRARMVRWRSNTFKWKHSLIAEMHWVKIPACDEFIVRCDVTFCFRNTFYHSHWRVLFSFWQTNPNLKVLLTGDAVVRLSGCDFAWTLKKNHKSAGSVLFCPKSS